MLVATNTIIRSQHRGTTSVMCSNKCSKYTRRIADNTGWFMSTSSLLYVIHLI